jgi:hypothetical protein
MVVVRSGAIFLLSIYSGGPISEARGLPLQTKIKIKLVSDEGKPKLVTRSFSDLKVGEVC